VFASLALAPSAFAAPVRVVGVDTGGYPTLQVTVVAPPGSGQPQLTENGNAVAGLQAVNLGQSKSVALLVDRSQSMAGPKLRNAIAAARSFVAGKAPADRVEVITFGHQAIALTGFSSSPADADVALRGLTTDPTPGTALWDAVALAAHKLGNESNPGRVIIVLTDGQDVSSADNFDQAVAAVHAAHATVYPIGIAGPGYAPGPLQDLAARTGGAYHQTSTATQLAAIYGFIGRTLSHTWELRYPTAARPGDTIKLVATVPGVGNSQQAVKLAAVPDASTPVPPSGLLPHSLWVSPVAPVALAGIVGLLVLLAVGFAYAARTGLWVRSRLDPHLGQVRRQTKTQKKRGRRELRHRLVAATEHTLANVKQFRALTRLLEQADLPLRGAELVWICLGTAILAGLFAAVLFASSFLTLVFLAGGALIPIGVVKFKAGTRIKTFDNQLPDLLITVSASLKAGHSFRHALQAVVDDAAEPAASEFGRVLSETQLGRPMDEALDEMSERVGSKNLGFVVTAVTIQRQVGGSLAGLFDMIAETVRQRQQFARRIRGLTAMGRMSAYVLIGLPFFIAAAITALNPAYMAPLYNTATGHDLILVGLVMMTIGSLILKKIVAFKG
jgi:tight adherence protein B